MQDPQSKLKGYKQSSLSKDFDDDDDDNDDSFRIMLARGAIPQCQQKAGPGEVEAQSMHPQGTRHPTAVLLRAPIPRGSSGGALVAELESRIDTYEMGPVSRAMKSHSAQMLTGCCRPAPAMAAIGGGQSCHCGVIVRQRWC